MNNAYLEERRNLWKLRVQEWENSGLSALTWCKDRNIPYKQFIYWKSRFQRSLPTTNPVHKDSFVELRPKNNLSAEIEVLCNDCTLVLRPGFDPTSLSCALKVIRGKV
jgi:hypothetical protein